MDRGLAGPRVSPLGDHTTSKDVTGDQPSSGETTWINTGAARYGRGQHKIGQLGDGMLRPLRNHGTLRLPNDDDLDHILLMCSNQDVVWYAVYEYDSKR